MTTPDNPVSQEQSCEEWKKEHIRADSDPGWLTAWVNGADKAWAHLTAHFEPIISNLLEDKKELEHQRDRLMSLAEVNEHRIAELQAQVALLEATLGMEYRILYGDGDRAPTGFMNLQPLSPTVEDLRLIRDELERIKGILHERTLRLAKYETGGGEVKSQWIPISTLPTYTKDTTCIVETSHGVYTDDWEPEYQEFEQMNKSVIRWMPLPPIG